MVVWSMTWAFPVIRAGTTPVFFDKHLYHTLPYADILPWDQISVMIDFDWLEAAKLNALDVLDQRFSREEALQMARKVRIPLMGSGYKDSGYEGRNSRCTIYGVKALEPLDTIKWSARCASHSQGL